MNSLTIRNHRASFCLSFFLSIILLACSKTNDPWSQETVLQNEQASAKIAGLEDGGAIQISGMGVYAETGECELTEGAPSYALKLTGDLNGCVYVFVDDYECSPSGTYREMGREKFVGTYKGQPGTFWTSYKFEAKYEGCQNGSPLGAEIFGRCQHPIIAGSGTGAFSGVSGRLDFKDDVEAGNFPYRGHLLY
jgi:hypothetical protein